MKFFFGAIFFFFLSDKFKCYRWEWAKCVEDGAALENKYGAGYTGLINIGSSCYMNSVC